mmetsp:Transcript_12013/g.36127  ORF Transcript_12013/g.36127 Transcript_12013/m.36127 type:complete len:111 (-) Transcript_12013:1105-1437(-)
MAVLRVFLAFTSVVLLVHAGFSTIHLKGLSVGQRLPPVDVVVEVLVAFCLATVTSLASMPELKPVRVAASLAPELEDRAFHSPDFLKFDHRGAALAQRRRALEKSKKVAS